MNHSPSERFALWLRGYMDARRTGDGARAILTEQDCSRIYSELLFATGDMVKLGGGMRELTPSDMIGQVYAANGQTISLAEQQRVEHELKQRAALQQRRDPDCPAHDTRCTPQECAVPKMASPGWMPRPSELNERDSVQNLGGGYGVPRGVR